MKTRLLLCVCLLANTMVGVAQNIGIGTSLPQARLQVVSDFEAVRLQGQSQYISFYDNAGSYHGYLWNRTNTRVDLGTPSGSNFPVLLSPNAVSAASFYPGGFAGIGNTNPAFQLDVSGRMLLRSTGETAGIWFNNTLNTGEAGFAGLYNNDHYGFYGGGSSWGLLVNASTGYATMNGGSPGSARLTVQNSSGPATQIDGDIRVSGTTPAAFRLTATSTNLGNFADGRYNSIVIDYALLNGDPAAIILMTPVNFTAHVEAKLQYDAGLGKWKIITDASFVPKFMTTVGNLSPCDGSSTCHYVNPLANGERWPGFQAGQTFNLLIIKQ